MVIRDIYFIFNYFLDRIIDWVPEHQQASEHLTHSFMESSCSFLGRISSIICVRGGNCSVTLFLMARCVEDLTFDFAPGVRLYIQFKV